MKRLLEQPDGWNKDCQNLAGEAKKAIEPIIDKWAKAGFSLVDIEHIICTEIGLYCAFIQIGKQIDKKD